MNRNGENQKDASQAKWPRRYEAELRELQIELVKIQKHVIKHDHKVLVIFEGRDASGKDGTIKRDRGAPQSTGNPRCGAWQAN